MRNGASAVERAPFDRELLERALSTSEIDGGRTHRPLDGDPDRSTDAESENLQ